MLIAMKHFGNVGVGATLPQLFRANDRNFYVVKLQNNQLGSKVLANEFLAAKLGEILGLCFPAGRSIQIEKETIRQSWKLRELGIAAGRHFASQYLNHTEYLCENNLLKATNITEMAGTLLFDYMFHNADRTNNKKNLLLRKEETGYKIYAIDNSHLFRSARWTVDHLNNIARIIRVYCRCSYGLLLRNWLSPVDFLPYVKKVQEISYKTIQKVVAEIPEEWLPDDKERQVLIHYIVLRKDMAEDICEVLYKQIPKSRGGYQEDI